MTDTVRLALAGAREYVVRAARTDPRAGQIVMLVDKALASLVPPPPPATAEEPWEFPEPTLQMPPE